MSMIILDVDTSERFMLTDGEDFVSGADSVLPNINKVIENALRYEKVIISNVYSPEMGMGVNKLSDTMLVDDEFCYTVPKTNNGIDMNMAETCWHIIFEKEDEDIWHPQYGQPDNFETFLRSEGVTSVVIIGCDFRDSITKAIDGLLRSEYHVRFVTDAIASKEIPIDDRIELITTKQFISECKREYEGNNA